MILLMCLKKAWRIAYPIVACLFAYTSISGEAFSILAFLLVFDTITGVIKAIAIGKKPTSRRFILWVISKLLMLSVPMLLALLCKIIIPETGVTWLVSSSIWLLATAETYSIIQNMVSIKLQKEIEEYDAVTWVMTYLLWQLRRVLDKSIPKT